MDLPTYRAKHGLSQAEFAKFMTDAGFPCTQSLVSQWERGVTSMTAEQCKNIEQATKGECTRIANRPDLFGEIPEAA